MRVLHFYKTFSPEGFGGCESFIRHLSYATQQEGVHNTVLALDQHSQEPIAHDYYDYAHAKENFNIASTGFSWSVFATFKRLAQQADLIHYHFPWPFMDVVHFATQVQKPTVVTYHSDIVRQKYLLKIYQPLMQRFLSSVDGIAATSPNYLQSSPVLQKYADKTTVIPIGMAEELYPEVQDAKVVEYQRRFGSRFFLFVGVLRYYKGLHYLLEACQNTPWPMVIVGVGPMKLSLKQQAQRLGLTNLHFIGEVSEQEKVNLLTACYSVVFPSHLRSEAFGISLLEGAMFAKPLICSEIGTGTSFINQHLTTGLVVEPASAQALRQAMQQLWDNPQQANKYGQAAGERYQQQFTAQAMGEAYVALYQRLLSA